MRLNMPRTVLLLLMAMLATPASTLTAVAAQESGIQWMSDLEAAKTLAKQTNRLVLVHFWTPSCGPCLTLDQTVFNQANVASVIDQRFVAVKLNANENSATAQGFGITRVPTDVVLTPDGQVVGKLISPPTPGAYIAEVMQVAAAYVVAPGQAFANAAAKAPAPSGLSVNGAYANLPVGAGVTPAAPAFGNAAPMNATGQQAPIGFAGNAASTFGPPALAPITPIGAGPSGPSPAVTMNPLAAQSPTQAANMAATPAAPPVADPSMPVQVTNRYASFAPNAGPSAATPAVPAMPVAQQQVPPATAAAPTSATGNSPMLISGTSSSALSLRPGALATPQVQPQQPPLQQTAPIQQTTTVQQPVQPQLAQPQTGVGAAAATAVPGTPDTAQLPAGSPPLGFDGYCPVSMRNNWKWVPGDPRWGIVHRGRTYWFASQTEQQQFWSDPDRFSPALSGMDPVMAIDHQQQVPGKREHSIDYDNLFYMFSSEATLAQFTANPERYAVGVREAMGIPRGRLVR